MPKLASILTAAACATAIVAAAAPAQAQSEGGSEVSATGKGIAGGALLGAEVVMLTEAAAGVRPAWAYAVGGGVGAVGGGVGGYFVEDSSAKVSLYLLAGGLALVIPTTVAVLTASAYEPPANYTEDKGPIDEPVADPPQAEDEPLDASGSTRSHIAAHAIPPSLVGYDEGLITLSVPSVEVRDVYSEREMAEFGVEQETEVHVPVVNVIF